MNHVLIATAAVTILSGAATAAVAQDIVIEDTMARIVWTEADDVSVEVSNPGDAVDTPNVQERNGRFTVTGDMEQLRSYSCRNRGGELQVRTSRFGDYRSIESFPVLEISAPADAHLVIEDSMIHGEIGDLGQGEIEMDGCGAMRIGSVQGDFSGGINGSGDIAVGDIGGEAELEIAGSGNLTSGDIEGGAELDIAGSGNLNVGRVRGETSIDVAGSGDTSVDSVEGPVDVDIAGSGDVSLGGGTADPLTVDIAGSGDVDFDGEARNPEISIMGSGDVTVNRYSGRVSKSVMGSGDFNGECAGDCD